MQLRHMYNSTRELKVKGTNLQGNTTQCCSLLTRQLCIWFNEIFCSEVEYIATRHYTSGCHMKNLIFPYILLSLKPKKLVLKMNGKNRTEK